MANEQIVINGEEYISMNHLVDCLSDTCLLCHCDGDLGSGDDENTMTWYMKHLLRERMHNVEAYDAFVRSYVHKKYPQVFGKEKES